MSGDGRCYIARGNRTADFYALTFERRQYDTLAPIPAGPSGKWPRNGSRGACDGRRFVYVAKGNTREFWRYDVAANAWQQLKDVYPGPNGRRVKAGSDMVYVKKNGHGYLYLLKGHTCEFCRFNVDADSWEALPDAPLGAEGKWPVGSWLVYDLAGTIYAHKAKYHEFYSYNAAKDSWNQTTLNPMPIPGTAGKRKSGAGSCGAWHNTKLYALKGGNTQELWAYVPAGDSWHELDDIPLVSSSGKKKKVKAGADMASYEFGNVPVVLLMLKGNSTNELWVYEEYESEAERRDDEVGAMARCRSGTPQATCSVRPNPVPGGRFTVTLTPSAAGSARLTIFDALGRCRASRFVDCRKRVELDVGQLGLSPGVYIARVDASGHSASAKFVTTR